MPPKQTGTVWPAEPHTIAKITLLSAYLKAWLSILGTAPFRRGQDILYVDGFAGPGEYTNYPSGSPIAAVESAVSVLNTHLAKWSAGDVHCAFIDCDEARIENLRRKLVTVQTHARVRISTHAATFVDGLQEIKRTHSRSFSQTDPLFVFIDPFGATGAPFSAVSEILRSRSSEVLINLDADGIARIFHAGNRANRDLILDEVFGDSSWKSALSTGAPFGVLCQQVLELYKSRLRDLPGVQYVFAFQMKGKTDSLSYYLVFASWHPRGLEKMKEAMKSIDQNGTYSFGDANVGQPMLFRFDVPADFAARLFDRFKGCRATYAELRNFSLNETPFTNPKQMLKWLEGKGLIADIQLVEGKTRRKGTFSEDAVVAIVFNH